MAKTAPASLYLLGVCASQLRAHDGAIQIFPAGEFRATDGRPTEVDAWRMDADIAARVIADLVNLKQNKIVIDYEHQTMLAEDNGKPAPAAGWFRAEDLEWREGKGLYITNPDWTDQARGYIERDEYEYVSPVFMYDRKTGAITRLINLGITNHPAIDNMDELELQAAAKKFLSREHEDQSMNKDLLQAILTLLGLEENPGEDQLAEAVTKLNDDVVALRADLETANQEKDKALAAAKAADGKVDPAKFISIEKFEELKTELTALKEKDVERDTGELIATAITAGKLVPAQEEWAHEFAEAHGVAALKDYIDNATPIPAVNHSQTGGKPIVEDGVEIVTADEVAVCKMMGIDPEDYKKTKQAMANG